MKPYIIGIAGGTGSGKTTLARHIADAFGDRVTVITHDSYYRLQEGKTYEERCLQNYDHPDAFETELLCEHLRRLCRGLRLGLSRSRLFRLSHFPYSFRFVAKIGFCG